MRKLNKRVNKLGRLYTFIKKYFYSILIGGIGLFGLGYYVVLIQKYENDSSSWIMIVLCFIFSTSVIIYKIRQWEKWRKQDEILSSHPRQNPRGQDL